LPFAINREDICLQTLFLLFFENFICLEYRKSNTQNPISRDRWGDKYTSKWGVIGSFEVELA